ncbi:hypothetical protein [uncultured Roseovarius sp.]|uniref:hypothetical protein n=1 Tax=uncultured Roseovarius sp. TaxID=293344 RepID=UPI00260AFEB9|nr:hypothetical protein [uncultured Roseovarius sp.]
MQRRLFKKLLGVLTALCLICALLSAKLDWDWSVQAAFWVSGLAGLIWATWDKAMPATRDETARAAQPGLYEGSHYGGGGGGDSSGG